MRTPRMSSPSARRRVYWLPDPLLVAFVAPLSVIRYRLVRRPG